jgi:cyclophilin family peptidyl-prolyl cis-trans isomerase
MFVITLSYSVGLAQLSIVSAQPQATVTHIVTIETSKGMIVIGLYGIDAPKTTENFVELAESGFYDGILFHRIVPGFVIQAGDPLTKSIKAKARWGTGGESIYGGEFADELNSDAPSYRAGYARGVLAMANSGPNTNLSQFFVCLADLNELPKNYTMFGKVLKGMEVVDAIAASPTENIVPKEPISIISTTVEKTEKKK